MKEIANSHTYQPKIEQVDPGLLVDNPRNARTHSKKQVKKIGQSIQRFGFTNPVLVDRDNMIIAGHGRVQSAKQLGLKTVPIIRIEHLSEAEKRAYVIADNRLAELAGWDPDMLTAELELLLADPELDFDIELTGFETGEIDVLIDGAQTSTDPDPADRLPEVERECVSIRGDAYRLGAHRLVCGDTRSAEDIAGLMQGRQAEMVFTDPPYNVRIDRNVCGLGAVKHGDFVMASGEMTESEFTEFLTTALGNLARHSTEAAIHFVCMDWRHQSELMEAGKEVYAELKNICVWAKTNGGMGSLYRSAHEFVSVFKVGAGKHINNVELGAHGRNRTNVWSYPGISSKTAARQEELALHPTVKPVALVADAIRDCSRRGSLILDGFAGSGTTIIAAEQTGRVAYAMELEPAYVDVCIKRWETLTGELALHESGKTFAELREERRATAALSEAT